LECLLTSRTAGAMSAGRPVRKRERGFANDIAALERLRTALRIDDKLDKQLVARAVASIDELSDRLVELHKQVAA
jgi:hypothetical protein